jgi:hypothetical protein
MYIIFREPLIIWLNSDYIDDINLSLRCSSIGFENVRINKSKYYCDSGQIRIRKVHREIGKVLIISGIKVSINNNFESIYDEEYNKLRNFCKGMDRILNSKALIIQRHWRRCISDPIYSICRRRLLREYSSIGELWQR